MAGQAASVQVDCPKPDANGTYPALPWGFKICGTVGASADPGAPGEVVVDFTSDTAVKHGTQTVGTYAVDEHGRWCGVCTIPSWSTGGTLVAKYGEAEATLSDLKFAPITLEPCEECDC